MCLAGGGRVRWRRYEYAYPDGWPHRFLGGIILYVQGWYDLVLFVVMLTMSKCSMQCIKVSPLIDDVKSTKNLLWDALSGKDLIEGET